MTPRFVAIDTETTGLGNDARVLEVGMVFSEGGEIVDSWRQRFNPKGVDWNSPGVRGALSVNGIDPSELAGCPDFSEVAEIVRMFLGRYRVWVGHNLSYDVRMLGLEFSRCIGVSWGKEEAFQVCTKELAKYYDSIERKKSSHKLVDTAVRFGVKLADAHTAVGDATATAEIFLHMVQSKRLPFRVTSVLDKILTTERAIC